MYQLALLIFLVSFSLFILVLLYILKSLFRELKNRGSTSSYERSLKILDAAKKGSIDIIRDANNRSQQILNESHLLNQQLTAMVENRIRIVSDRQSKHFEEISTIVMNDFHKEVREETTVALQGIKSYFSEVNETVRTDMTNYAKEVKKDLLDSQDFLSQVIKDKRLEIEKELDAYKLDKLRSIDTQLSALVDKVFVETLKTNLEDKDKQALLLGALEYIKKSPEYRSL